MKFHRILIVTLLLLSPVFGQTTQPASGEPCYVMDTGARVGRMFGMVAMASRAVPDSIAIPSDSTPSSSVAAATRPAAVQEDRFHWPELDRWQFTAGFGLTAIQDTRDSAAMRVNVGARYQDTEDIWRLDGSYLLSWEREEFDNQTDAWPRRENRADFSIDKQWLFAESPAFAFGNVKWRFDEFKSWRNQVQLNAGPGWYLVQLPEYHQSIRLGGDMTNDFQGPRRSPIAQGLLGAEMHWQVTETVVVKLSNYFYPSINYFGESRNVTTARCEIDLGRVIYRGLMLSFNLDNEYLSHTEGNDSNNSLTFFSGLNLAF